MSDFLPFELLQKIKLLRKQYNLSQEAVAFELNISQAAYSKIENGSTMLTVEHLYALAQVFGCPVSDFFLLPAEEFMT